MYINNERSSSREEERIAKATSNTETTPAECKLDLNFDTNNGFALN